MSRKPPELSADLVAIKGSAAPTPDMPGRMAPALVAPAVDAPAKPATREALTPLNFRIPASFRREFKTYAATHDLKLNELLRLAFDAYRKQRGN